LFCVLWFSVIVSAAVGVAFFHCTLRLGYSPRVAYCAAALLGLGSMLLPYTRLFFTEPLTVLLALLAFHFGIGLRRRDAAWCGLFAGLLASNNVVYLLSLPLFLGAVTLERGETPRQTRAVSFGLGTAPGLLFLAAQMALRGPGYAHTPGFITPLAVGLFGFLLSPGKSLFVFSPILLLSLAGFPSFARRHRRPALLALAFSAVFLILYSKWFLWTGGTCWGPRFLLPLIPLLWVGALPILQRFPSLSRLSKAAVVGIAATSLWVQASAGITSPYLWFHYTLAHLQIQMVPNRFEGKHPDVQLLVLQSSIPYFPEYCPPYLESQALWECIRTGESGNFSPMWIRYGIWAWGAAGLLIAAGSLAWGWREASKDRSGPARREERPAKRPRAAPAR
ncbi:MAG: hypothetical protein NTW86_23985, partial [Candidatus Sumerlaeota bacterium]|nr:hypothetical protein [Candidatus Sumerlaeota bacterium]